MKRVMKRHGFKVCVLAGLAGWAAAGAGEEGVRLTLGTESFRGSLEEAAPAFERWPDVRLKLEAPAEVSLSVLEQDPRVRGIEIRLPMSWFWMGYEWAAEGDEPRATFSIQREF
jgi:hypothetical protein